MKVCKILNYTEHLPILASAIIGCVLISAFASLIGTPVGIVSSATTIKISVVAAGIKKYKSIIKKKKKKHGKILWLAKTNLNTTEVLILRLEFFGSLWISHDEFVSVNNVLKEYDDVKEGIKNSNNK